jgi:hypothetical protein
MARLRVTYLREGQHPSETMVSVPTANGSVATTIVDADSFEDGSIEIGYPVASDAKRYLVELPRETLTGQWRLWVKREDVVGELVNA